MRDHDSQEFQEERESIWTVPSRWKSFYFKSFVILILLGTAATVWCHLFEVAYDSALATAVKIGEGTGAMVAASAGLSVFLVEVMEMFSRQFDRWLSERQRAQGRAEGQALERAEWMAWDRRRREAEARGEPFDEPNPSERKKAERL